jgi:hypothetical protein
MKGELFCTCEDWPMQIENVNGPIVLASLRNPAYRYPGKSFVFCPWCGAKLHERAVLETGGKP